LPEFQKWYRRAVADRTGLRERKRQRTHDAVSSAAISLFLEHGFDRVSVADIAAAAEVARTAGKVGTVGYCWGGFLSAAAAINLAGTVDASVGYYGGGIANSLLDQVPRVPLMLHFGELDHAIPLEDVEKVKAAWPDAAVYVYPGAQHGFGCDERASYDKASADLAWPRAMGFFGKHLT
jgi:carboxymethylenebutenolidase